MADSQTQLQIVISAIDNASAQLKQIADNSTGALNQTTTSANATSGSFTSMAGAMFAGLSVFSLTQKALSDIKDITVESVEAFSEFQGTMDRLQTQVGLTGEQVDNLSQSILTMSSETAQGPADLAAVLLDVSKAGFTGSAALDLVKGSADLAAISGANLSDSERVLVEALNSHIKGATDLGTAQSDVNAILGGGRVTMEDLANVLGGRVAPMLQMAGLSLKDVGAALDVYGNAGLDASTESMGLGTAISTMINPTKTAKEALDQIGLSQTQLANDMQTGGIVKAVSDLNSHMNDSKLSSDELGQVMIDVFSRRGVAAIEPLLENLPELKQKVDDITNSTGNFGKALEETQNTQEYQMNQASANWKILLTEIGAVLAGTILPVLKAFNDAMDYLTSANKLAAAATQDYVDIEKNVNKTQDEATQLIASGNKLLVEKGNLLTQLAKLEQLEADASQAGNTAGFNHAMQEIDAINKKISATNTSIAGDKTATDTLKTLGNTTKDVTANIDNMSLDLGGAATTALVKHADAVAAVTTEYDKMQTSASADLDSLSSEFETKMGTIQETIEKTQQSITDLTANYNDTQTSDTASVADKIVASQQKIADLTTQLSQATTDSEITTLQKELSDEQANYASSYAWRQANVAAMSAAVQKASETDLQRTIDAENAKESAETKTYNDKLAQLQDTLQKAKDESMSEMALYNQKVLAIAFAEATATDAYKKESNSRIAQTTDEVTKEKAQFTSLASTISSIKGASNTAAVSSFIGPIQTVHDAIITPSGIVKTDPQDYLIATKNPGGMGGSNIIVNVNGGTYLDQNAARIFGNKISKAINQNLKLRTV